MAKSSKTNQKNQPGRGGKPAAAKQTPKKAQNTTLPWLWIGIGALALIAVIAAGVLLSRPAAQPAATGGEPAALPAEISVSDAYARYQQGAYVLDVRTQEEWDEYHAPNTTLIPLDQLASRVAEVPTDREVVVVCRSGNRSQEGRDILKAAGFTTVTSMAGGLKEWRSAGYPVENGN
jgi:rhodanese-related sulfurtransferase